MVVTAQSATGTCHGPTIWSSTVMPPTLRSPMVIRKDLSATVGSSSTFCATSTRSMPVRSIAGKSLATWTTSRCIFGGLPSKTSIGMSTGSLPSSVSISFSWRSSVATPTAANRQRSRSHMALNNGRLSGAIAST